MKKKILTLVFAMMLTPLFAINISDIDTIFMVSSRLQNDSRQIAIFAGQLRQLRDSGFQLSIANSTQTIALTNQQKQDLLAYYQSLKQNLQDDVLALP